MSLYNFGLGGETDTGGLYNFGLGTFGVDIEVIPGGGNAEANNEALGLDQTRIIVRLRKDGIVWQKSILVSNKRKTLIQLAYLGKYLSNRLNISMAYIEKKIRKIKVDLWPF